MLTDLACRSLIAKSKQIGKPLKKHDRKGLFLYALPKGTAYWRQKYRINGRENQMSFGSYPEISLSEARDKHTEAYKLVLEGIDPAKARQEAARKRERQSRDTFEAIGRSWHKHNIERWSPDHGAEILARMEGNLFGHIVPLSSRMCDCSRTGKRPMTPDSIREATSPKIPKILIIRVPTNS